MSVKDFESAAMKAVAILSENEVGKFNVGFDLKDGWHIKTDQHHEAGDGNSFVINEGDVRYEIPIISI